MTLTWVREEGAVSDLGTCTPDWRPLSSIFDGSASLCVHARVHMCAHTCTMHTHSLSLAHTHGFEK